MTKALLCLFTSGEIKYVILMFSVLNSITNTQYHNYILILIKKEYKKASYAQAVTVKLPDIY